MTNNEIADMLEKLAKHFREREQESVRYTYNVPSGRPMCEACRRGGVCGCYQPEWDSPTS